MSIAACDALMAVFGLRRVPATQAGRFVVGDRVVPCGFKRPMEVVRVRGTVYRLRDDDGSEHDAHDGELISESDAPWARTEEPHV